MQALSKITKEVTQAKSDRAKIHTALADLMADREDSKEQRVAIAKIKESLIRDHAADKAFREALLRELTQLRDLLRTVLEKRE